MKHEKRFHGHSDMLRSQRRLAQLEVSRVVALCLEGLRGVHNLLDVGTGSGLFAEAFGAQVAEVVGVDVNPDMVALARKLVPGIRFALAPMEALPFASQTFDVVYMGHVLHETDDLHRALAEARRCARMRVAALEWPYRQQEMGPPLAHRLAPPQVQEAAAIAGFQQVEVLYLQHMTLYRLTI